MLFASSLNEEAMAQKPIIMDHIKQVLKLAELNVSVMPTAGTTTASVTIDWHDVPGVTQYRFRFRPQGALNWNVSTITGSERTYNYLSFNTVYEVQIRVYESATHQGEYSPTYIFTTPPIPGNLPNCIVPTPSTTVLNANSAQISWTPVLFSQSFQVQLRAKNTLVWGGTTTAYNQVLFNALLPNTCYEYRVRTQCQAGTTDQGVSDFSIIDSFRTPEVLICPTPLHLMPVWVHATSAMVSWTGGANAQGYNVQMRVKNAATWGGTTLSDTAYTFINLSPSTTYEFRVRSVCSNIVGSTTTSAFSVVAEFTTAAIPLENCLAPAQSIAIASLDAVTISWDSSINGQSYFVQIKPSTALQWGGSSTSNCQLTFNRLSPNTAYQYRIRTTCVAGTTHTPMSTFSAIQTFNTSALRQGLIYDKEGVYPNPTAGQVTVIRSTTQAELYKVFLTDVTGRLLYQTNVECAEGTATWSFSMLPYPRGVYFMRVIDCEGLSRVYTIQRE
jgi:hypothetical protein